MGALIGGGIATILSLCILSRVISDNPLYRFGQSVLVGAAIGYVTAVVARSVIVPPLDAMVFGRATTEEWIVTLVGLGLGLTLVTRFGRQRGSHLANYALALLFGASAAVALLGAVRGTLGPQLLATVRLPILEGGLERQIGTAVLALCTIITLLTFTYRGRVPSGRSEAEDRRRALLLTPRAVGRGLILVAFGVFFAATVTTYISALVGQLAAISEWAETLWVFVGGS